MISLSPDSRPRERRTPRSTAVGIVKVRKEGAMNIRSMKMLVILPPLMISSINLKILSMRRIIVKVIRPIRKIGRISFKI